MSEAPTVIAKIVGHEHLTDTGLAHYAYLKKGTGLISHRGESGVAVHSSCCEVALGTVAADKAAELIKWMDNGYTFMTEVYEPPFTQPMLGDVRVIRPMEAKFTPLPSMKAKASVKDAAPKELEEV